MFFAHHPVTITCDSGATSSLVRHSTAIRLGMDIKPTAHTASQADGKSKLTPSGEVHVQLTRGDHSFILEAVVVKELDCDILAGVPFMRTNKIVLDIPRDKIIVNNKHEIAYSSQCSSDPKVRRSVILRPSKNQSLYPGEFLEMHTDLPDQDIAVEPRTQSSSATWIQPTMTESINGVVRIPNLTDNIVSIKKHDHIVQIYHTTTICSLSSAESVETSPISAAAHSSCSSTDNIKLDPHKQLSLSEITEFNSLHARYHQVFSGKIGCYNDASGRLRASINMGPVEPPPQKARLPSYSSEKMKLLQEKMDELENLGVLAKPEDVHVTVEHVSPSFLVHKSDGNHRLVTAFNDIGTYAKPLPSRSVCTDDVLRFLAGFKFIIKTDMTKQFFQLPMKKESMKYLGVLTPYKGLRVYTRAAMGMPGSTEHLDELMSRVLGEMLQRGKVMKLADDLYIGGNCISDLLSNWEELLQRFETNNLKLSPTKTEICPVTTTILGWVWTAGSITASPHKVSPIATADLPTTVKGLRSWIGAYKHLKSCVPQYSSLLSELEGAVAGKESNANIKWTDELCDSFRQAQAALSDIKSIMIPKPQDKLIITTDGAVKCGGIGAILYIMRGEHMHLGGFFSAKLKPHQRKWLPCEVEALAISSAVNHWGPYILESEHTVQLLSDSRPCVQAFKRLIQGCFSHSARVSTFLATLSRYNVTLQHIPGNMNLPADYQSRNPPECDNNTCQICRFISDTSESICRLQVSDILEGKCALPYSSPAAWKATQQDCPLLRRAYAHLSQGTRPSKKTKNIREVKRYMSLCSIGRDGLLVVRKEFPFANSKDLIVIPSKVLPGLISALHLRLEHPSKHQMSKVFHRYFYGINADSIIGSISDQCHLCSSIAKLPNDIEEFSTTDEPLALGTHFACDVLRRANQVIFVVRDEFSSFTIARLIDNEKCNTIRDAIIETTAELRSPHGCVIRADGALQPLQHDKILQQKRLIIEIGRLKNRNKNPVAEKAIQELEIELKKSLPDGRSTDSCELACITAILNHRIRNRGLSAHEIVYQRDASGQQLNISDDLLSSAQHEKRIEGHSPSARCQAKTSSLAPKANVSVGDLVFIKNEGDKHTARDKYIIVSHNNEYLSIRKLIGNQFRSKVYEVKPSEIYPVPISQNQTFRKSQSDVGASSNAVPNNSDNLDQNSELDSSSGNNSTQSDINDDNQDDDMAAHQPHHIVRRHPARRRRQPRYLQEYVLNSLSDTSNTDSDD